MSSTHGNERVSDQEILEAFDEIRGPYVTAGELSEVLPISRSAINERLKDLLDEGLVERKKPTQNMAGWWRPENHDSAEM